MYGLTKMFTDNWNFLCPCEWSHVSDMKENKDQHVFYNIYCSHMS